VNDWKREAISLNNYMGKNVKFRFHLKADAGVEFDGYYFDDFQVDMLIDATSVSDHMPAGAFLGYPYPNPTKNKFEVSYTLPQNVNQAELVITTPEGKSVSTTHLNPQNNKADINTSHLSPGFYIINIKSANYRSIVRKLVIQ
jgi:hypothetical protein